MTKTMLAARLHEAGRPLRVEEVARPTPQGTDVVIAVKACNIVPNLANVVSADWPHIAPNLPLPKLPAILGLDVAGIVAEVGEDVHAVRPGDRVYVNPARGCGSCRMCRAGEYLNCDSFIYQGYFGRGPLSQKIFERYPYGGLAEYTLAPATALVKLPASVSFEEACRFGYLGTGYGALRKAGAGTATSILINGATGTLGVGAVLVALAMGLPRIFAVARDTRLLDRMKQLAPDRIETLSVAGGDSISAWAMELPEGEGIDGAVDCLPPRAPSSAQFDALRALRMGGSWIDVGGVADQLVIPPYFIKTRNLTLAAGRWFTTGQGEDLAAMARAHLIKFTAFEHRRFALGAVNDAIAALKGGDGGFTNFVVIP